MFCPVFDILLFIFLRIVERTSLHGAVERDEEESSRGRKRPREGDQEQEEQEAEEEEGLEI